jgi:hypothetical protein
MFIPDPDLYPPRIPDPDLGSNNGNKRGRKFVVLPFFVDTNMKKFIIIYPYIGTEENF